jgi:hypothetical protein
VTTLLLPTDVHGAESDFRAVGFSFAPPYSENPQWRMTTLPRAWQAKGQREREPLYIVDELLRRRAVVVYIPHGQGQTFMRLTSLREYLDECVGTGTPVHSCEQWATPEDIRSLAVYEAAHALSLSIDLTRQGAFKEASRRAARAAGWTSLAERFAPELGVAA